MPSSRIRCWSKRFDLAPDRAGHYLACPYRANYHALSYLVDVEQSTQMASTTPRLVTGTFVRNPSRRWAQSSITVLRSGLAGHTVSKLAQMLVHKPVDLRRMPLPLNLTLSYLEAP